MLHGHWELFHQCFEHDLLLVNVPLIKLQLYCLHVLVSVWPLNILRLAESNDDFTLHILWEESNLVLVKDEHLYFGRVCNDAELRRIDLIFACRRLLLTLSGDRAFCNQNTSTKVVLRS